MHLYIISHHNGAKYECAIKGAVARGRRLHRALLEDVQQAEPGGIVSCSVV